MINDDKIEQTNQYTWICNNINSPCRCIKSEDMFPGYDCDCVVIRDGISPVRCAKCMRKLVQVDI